MNIYLGAEEAKKVADILAKECDFIYESIMGDQAPFGDLEEWYCDFAACVSLFDQTQYSEGPYGNYHDMLDECYRKLYGEDI